MSRRCGSWLLKCSTCNEIYKITNFMYRSYEETGTGRVFKSNLHKLKHLEAEGKVAKVLTASESRRYWGI